MSLRHQEIVKNAWKSTGLNQVDFASKYGISQSGLSRYINGKLNPPEAFLMQCMHILGILKHDDVSTQELIKLIEHKLSQPERSLLRQAIFYLISSIE